MVDNREKNWSNDITMNLKTNLRVENRPLFDINIEIEGIIRIVIFNNPENLLEIIIQK
jgi:hypothetical protein